MPLEEKDQVFHRASESKPLFAPLQSEREGVSSNEVQGALMAFRKGLVAVVTVLHL